MRKNCKDDFENIFFSVKLQSLMLISESTESPGEVVSGCTNQKLNANRSQIKCPPIKHNLIKRGWKNT